MENIPVNQNIYNEKLISELKDLNTKLNELNSSKNRYMVFSAKPFRFMWYNFLAGMFHMLGMVFGTAIVVSVLVYLFSRLDITKPISNWIESTLQQVRWEKVVPQPSSTIKIDKNLLDSLEQ